MSLKSFDKFCENMILSESGSQKEVFDERQNQVRSSLFIEALFICFFMSLILVGLNETSLQWCEECFPLMILSFAVSYLWNVIRCAVKGCLFGVKGSGTIAAAFVAALMGFNLLITYSPDWEESFIINNGLVTSSFVMLISALIMFVSFIVVLVMNIRRKKKQASDCE